MNQAMHGSSEDCKLKIVNCKLKIAQRDHLNLQFSIYNLQFAIFLLLAVALPARAALDPATSSPYKLVIVLHVENHPLFTPFFRQQMERDLGNALRLEWGKACVVEITRQHALMDEVLKDGWKILDRPATLSDAKLHLVKLTQADGQYVLEARQLDGSTGFVTPLRRLQTADRTRVAREAALMIARDFGMIGTIKEASGNLVTLSVQGADLAALHLRTGDVFALFRIRKGKDEQPQSVRIPDAVLQVQEISGHESKVRLHHRFEDPLRIDPAALGFRALKLGTRSGRLQLRVLDADSGEPLVGCAVSAGANGFEPTQFADLGATDAQGRVQSTEVFRNIAFARLSFLGKVRAQIPIPLLTDDPVEVRLRLTEDK